VSFVSWAQSDNYIDTFNSKKSTWVLRSVGKDPRLKGDSAVLILRLFHLNCIQIKGSPSQLAMVKIDSVMYKLDQNDQVTAKLKKGVRELSLDIKEDILLFPMNKIWLDMKKKRVYKIDIFLSTKRLAGQL